MKNIDFRNGRPLVMMVSQYDFGYSLQAALWSNGTPVTITAAEIVSENFTTTCTFSGNVVTIPVTTSMTERFGHFPAELRVTDSTGQVSSKNFDFFVERSPLAVKSTQTYEGDIVEFTAKRVPLSSVVVTMEPIQDLNGYSSPWPAGGGKNLLSLTTSGIEAANPTRTWTNHSTTISGVTITIVEDDNGNVTGIKFNGTATASIQFFTTRSLSLVGDYILNGGVNNNLSVSVQAKGTSVGSDFRFTDDGTVRASWIAVTNGATVDNVTVKPMIRLATDTDPTFEPYSNICPITGRTGASVFVGSKNKAVLPTSTITRNGVVLTPNADGTISANGTVTTRGWVYTGGATIPLSNFGLAIGDTVTISVNSGNRLAVNFRDDSAITGQGVATTTPTTMIVPTGTKYVQVYFYAGQTQQDVGTVINTTIKAQLEKGSTATDWTPYKTTTYPITFTSAGTVYAGTVDLVSGRLEVTHGGYTFTGDETFGMNGGNTNIIYFNGNSLANPMKSGTWNDDENTLCSSFEKVMSNADFGIRFGANSKYIYFYQILNMLGIASIADWKTWLASNSVQIAYPLETPLTYNLTPTQVMSLLGENVVWSEDGEVTVVVPEYY